MQSRNSGKNIRALMTTSICSARSSTDPTNHRDRSHTRCIARLRKRYQKILNSDRTSLAWNSTIDEPNQVRFQQAKPTRPDFEFNQRPSSLKENHVYLGSFKQGSCLDLYLARKDCQHIHAARHLKVLSGVLELGTQN